MLRYAHFDMKGGNRTFAAVCIEVCCADFATIRKIVMKGSLTIISSIGGLQIPRLKQFWQSLVPVQYAHAVGPCLVLAY